jgi:spermidine synthase
LRGRLQPRAIVALQGFELSFLDDAGHAALARTLRTVFSEVHSYQAHIPSFLGSWGFILASDWFRPAEWPAATIDAVIGDRLGSWMHHVDGNFLKGRFALCKETRQALSGPGPVLEDGSRFVPPPQIREIVPERVQFPAIQGWR